MKINYQIVTLAIKFNYPNTFYRIDNYVRMFYKNDNNKELVENFMKEYAGNAIERVVVIDKYFGEIDINTFTELQNIYNKIVNDCNYEKESINTTILEY